MPRRPLDSATWIAASVLLLWSLIPLAFLLVHIARHGGVWSGSEGLLAGSDQQLYLAWIRESGSDVLISNEFRIGDSRGVFLHPMFLISGGLWRAGVPIEFTLLLWKPVAAAVLGAGIWLYTGRFLAGRERVAAASLAAFYFSPALPLLVWTGAGLDGLDRFMLTLVSGESMAALQLWGYLHAALVIGLMAFFVLGVERVLAGGSRRALVAVTATGLILAWIHPWQGAIMLAVLGGMAAWGRFDRRYRVLAVPAAALLAPMVYEFLLSRLDVDWREDAAQNAGAHAELWLLLLALAPLVLPALAGLRLRETSDRERMLVLWAVGSLAVYFASPQFPFHALQGLTIPFAVLAVRGWRRARAHPALSAGAIALVTLPGLVFLVDTFRESRDSGLAPYVLDDGENAALEWLEDAPGDGGVLSRYYLGMAVPQATGRSTWVGQFTWTPDFDERAPVAEDLLTGRLTPARARAVARGSGARWVLVDCQADGAALVRALGPLVRATHRFGCAGVIELAGSAHRAAL